MGALDKFYKFFEDSAVYTPEDQAVIDNGGTVEIKLTVKKEEAPPEAVKVEAVKQAHETVGLYLDLTITKTVQREDGSQTSVVIPQIATLVETIIPLPTEMQGKASYTVYRVHNSTAEALPQGAGSEYYTISGDKTLISIFASKYSTYAIAWSDEAGTSPTPSTPPTPPVTPTKEAAGTWEKRSPGAA